MGYLNSYYIGNVLLVLIYPIHKMLKLNSSILSREDTFGFTYENSILYTTLTLLALNYIRSYSMPQFVSETLLLLKIMVFCFYTFVGLNYALVYMGVCFAGWLVLSYPKYTGPSNFVRITSAQQLQEMLAEDRPTNKIRKTKKRLIEQQKILTYAEKRMWFVEFYADWAPTCMHAKEIWAEFSVRYTTKRFRFATVNLARVDGISSDYSINTSGLSRQLPTVILFEDGEEVMRFPPIDPKTKKVGKVLKYESKTLAKYFDLEQRYLQTKVELPS